MRDRLRLFAGAVIKDGLSLSLDGEKKVRNLHFLRTIPTNDL